MIMNWWMCRLFFLLFIAVHVSIGLGGISSFWEKRVSREDALAFFKEMNEEYGQELASFNSGTTGTDNDSNVASEGFTKSNVGRASGNATLEKRVKQKGNRRKSKEDKAKAKANRRKSKGDKANRRKQKKAARRKGSLKEAGPSIINKAAMGTAPTDGSLETKLKLLTGNVFNGANFELEEDGNEITGDTRDTGCELPGGITYKGSISVKYNEEERVFKHSEIDMEGTISLPIKDKVTLQAEVTITKENGAEVFQIVTASPPTNILEKLDLAADLAKKIEDVSGKNVGKDIISKLQGEIGEVSSFGAFDKDSLQLVVRAAGESTISTTIGANSVNLILGFSTNSDMVYSLLIDFNDVQTKLAEISGQADLFAENPFLKDITSTGCVFLVSATTFYFDIIKGNADLGICFGNQETLEEEDDDGNSKEVANPEKEVFEELGGGLHARLEVDFQSTLAACWEGRTEDRPASFEEIDSNVKVYGKITKSGINARLLSNVKMPFKMAKMCAGGLLRKAPEYFSKGQVVLQHFSKNKDENNKTLWKIILSVKPNEGETLTIPGTTISLENLEIDTENKYDENGNNVWDLNANLETKIGRESDIVVSYVKADDSINLKITSSRMTIGDLLYAFNIGVTEDSILNKLGIKDFKLEKIVQEKGSAEEYTISGKPIIFGFENLEFSAFLAKLPLNETTTYAVGIYLNGADFTPIMKNVLGNDDISLQWLTDLKAVVTFTNYPGHFVMRNRAKKRNVLPGLKKSLVKKKNVGKVGNGTTLSEVLVTKKIVKRDDEEPADEEPDEHYLDFDELHEGLDGRAINYTVTIGVFWTIPKKNEKNEKCFDNPLCEWMAEYLTTEDEQPELSIVGEFGDGQVKLEVALSGLDAKFIDSKEEQLIFKEMRLFIRLGSRNTKLEISAAMTYANIKMGVELNNPLRFQGLIAATPIQLSLTFSMDGFAKLNQYIQIGNLMLGGGFSGGQPCFVFGGAIKLGDFGAGDPIVENEHAIEIRGYISVSIGSPDENWIYGSINALTVERVCLAFKLNCDDMTDALLQTGFPNGIVASYSSKERSTEAYGDIPQGLQVEGTINIFGFECYTNLRVVYKDNGYDFTMDIEMSPLDWGNGMIQIRREEGDLEKGPTAHVEIASEGKSKDFSFEIKGYANLLSVIQAEVEISVNKTQFFFYIRGYLIPGFVVAGINMTANYGVSGASDTKSDPIFSFVATVETEDLAEKLKEAIKMYVEELNKKVKAAEEYAIGKVDEIQAIVDKVGEKVENWTSAINSWQDSLKAKQEELKGLEPPKCECKDVCLPFLDWNPRCWKIWGFWVGCPFWNTCFRKVPDVTCLATCALRRVVTTLQTWAKQALMKVGQLILAGVQGLLKLAEKVLSLATKVLDKAKEVVSIIADKICDALKMAEETVTEKLGAMQLHSLELSASLTADYSACVGYTYHVEFFDETYEGDGEACLDFASFTKALIGGVLDGNDKTKGATKTNDRLKEADSQGKEVTKSEGDLKSMEAKADSKVTEDVKEATTGASTGSVGGTGRSDIPKLEAIASKMEKIPRAHNVPTREEMERIKLIERNLPTYDVRGDSMVRSFVDQSPWNLPMYHLPVGHDQTVQRDDTETLQKRTLDFESELSPCARMKRALSGYSDLTDGLLEYSKAVARSTKEMGASKLARDEKLDRFRKEIDSAVTDHNMTTSEREDAYYLYHQLSARHEELEKKSMIAMHTEDKYAMPIIRRQLNDLLDGEKRSTFMEFTAKMHENAVQGYKRSKIPTPVDVEGEKVLRTINSELQSIVTTENNALTPMTSRLYSVKKNIVSMSELAKKCDHK